MTGLFEQMAVDSRNVARGRTERLYKITIAVGNSAISVDAWAVNVIEAMRKATEDLNLDGTTAKVSARLVG